MRINTIVIETATLPKERADKISSPWLVEDQNSGYLLGCSSEECARDISKKLNSQKIIPRPHL